MGSEISPKVAIPALILFGLGVVAIVAGVLLESDELTSAGAAAIAASGIGGIAGYRVNDPARASTEAERVLQAAAPAAGQGAPADPADFKPPQDLTG
jgi:hypothetical protein